MADKNIGKITQVIGAVLDLKFSEGYLPEINDAVEITRKDGGKLVVEVAQHLGDDIVRCIAMGPTDGLVRGMDAVATGGPISVPVGEATLGRIFNVLGEPIDEKRLRRMLNTHRFTEKLQALKSRQHRQRCWRQVSRLLTFCAHIRKVEKSVCSVEPV